METHMGLKQNVANAFASAPVSRVNFSFANRLITPLAYMGLAFQMDGGRLKVAVDTNLAAGVEAEYRTDPTNTISGTIFVPTLNYAHSNDSDLWLKRANLIHEGAHAILDAFYPVINGKP